MKKRHWALVTLILLGILAWLQYQLWFGVGGKQEVAILAAQLEEQEERNQLLKQRNDALAAEVDDLKGLTSGGAAIEERARDEFGLIKPGETFYRVVDERQQREQ